MGRFITNYSISGISVENIENIKDLLELEIVHNKKYYKTIDGKAAQSLCKSPVIVKMKIKFYFKKPPMIY